MLLPATIQARGTENSSTANSKETTIIIAVVSSLGGLIVLTIAFSVYRAIRRRTSKPPPFPPAQALAHHREQHLAQFQASLSYESSLLTPALPSSRIGSQSSLFGKDKHLSTSPSYASETGETAEDAIMSMSPMVPGADLPMPNPRFTVSSESASSLRSDTSSPDSRPASSQPSPTRSQYNTRQPKAQKSSNRQRPLSMTSTGTSISRSSRRGLPHDPNSGVQVILPTPLSASQVRSSSISAEHASARYSVADPWASAALGPDSSLAHTTSSSNLRGSFVGNNARPGPSPTSAWKGPRRPSSAQSYSPNESPLSSSFPSTEEAPPVPRVPSMYSSSR